MIIAGPEVDRTGQGAGTFTDGAGVGGGRCLRHKRVNVSYLPGWIVGFNENSGSNVGCLWLPQVCAQ